MEEIRLKNGNVTFDRRLDRIPEFDEKSRKYPIRSFIGAEKLLRPYTWAVGANRLADPQLYLDQGYEGACVGFGCTHWLAARPARTSNLTGEDARQLYFEIQRNDPWPGGAYPGAEEFYEGTSVLSGARIMQQRGYFSSYRWAFSERDIALAIGYVGPVILGLNWYEGMFETDENGFISPTGEWMGGHCVIANGVSLKGDYYLIHNSWGPGWGVNGRAKIRRADMDRLLHENGEACLPVRQKR